MQSKQVQTSFVQLLHGIPSLILIASAHERKHGKFHYPIYPCHYFIELLTYILRGLCRSVLLRSCCLFYIFFQNSTVQYFTLFWIKFHPPLLHQIFQLICVPLYPWSTFFTIYDFQFSCRLQTYKSPTYIVIKVIYTFCKIHLNYQTRFLQQVTCYRLQTENHPYTITFCLSLNQFSIPFAGTLQIPRDLTFLSSLPCWTLIILQWQKNLATLNVFNDLTPLGQKGRELQKFMV